MLKIEQRLQQAVALHQAGELQKAEIGYRAILQTEPHHPKANHNLGTLYVQMDQPAAGLPYLTAALDVEPSHGQYWLSYVDALHRAGQTGVAREILALARQHGLSGEDVDDMEESLGSMHGRGEVVPETYCPVCGTKGVSFQPLPEFYRENAKRHGFERFGQGEMISLESYSCSRCGASDRERVYALWIDVQLESGELSRSAKVLHFAPEPALSAMLRQRFVDYTTADFAMGQVDFRVDIQNMPFADQSYDLFICSHVLEHVESDERAIGELYRITRSGGRGILVAPISLGLEKTLEDPSVTDEAGRWRLFGQNDHVRLYAHDDYVNKIRNHGFRVDELGEGYFGEAVFLALGLKQTSILYIVGK